MDLFDPNEHDLAAVRDHLKDADEAEVQRVLAAERAGKHRKTLLAEHGIDPNERVDASGRVLRPWEMNPEDHLRPVEVTPESAEEHEVRLEEAERGEGTEQPAADPAGNGVPGDVVV